MNRIGAIGLGVLVMLQGVAHAGVRTEAQSTLRIGTPGEVFSADEVEPAAGGDIPSLLDQRAEELKGQSFADTLKQPETSRDAAQRNDDNEARQTLTPGNWRVLSSRDVAAYKEALAVAKTGKMPSAASVKNPLLWGEVQRVYLLHKKAPTFAELNSWLQDHRDMAGAREVYDLAQDKRARPKQVCHTEKVKQQVKGKGKHAKTRTKIVKQKVCKMVGSWGPEPVSPLATELKEAAKDARQAAREAELAKLSAEGRRVLGQSWRLRGRGDYTAALDVLLAPGARVEAGNANWQGELVKIASYYHGKRDWATVVRAAAPAARVDGPDRDDARWLAGYALYRLGRADDALEQFRNLVKEQPATSPHYGRGAWWGARAARELGKDGVAKAFLEEGAKDRVSFYGQLCAARLGRPVALSWAVPEVSQADMGALQKVEGALRGIAFLQLGDVAMAQREFKLADMNMPYEASRPLAILATKVGLPATALAEAKTLKDRGDLLPAALFPVPEHWAPHGGWRFDKALMLGIMRQESAFQPQIGSRVGAQGLMQLMPATANYVARMQGLGRMDRSDLHDPATNLALAQAYLKYLSGKLDGNLMLVVAAYNGGIGNVQRWLDRGVTPGRDPVLWLESIPFDETRDYVEKVFANYWLYQQRLGITPWSLQALADGFWPVRWGRADTVDTNG